MGSRADHGLCLGLRSPLGAAGLPRVGVSRRLLGPGPAPAHLPHSGSLPMARGAGAETDDLHGLAARTAKWPARDTAGDSRLWITPPRAWKRRCRIGSVPCVG